MTSFHCLYLRIRATARSWDNRFLITHDDDEHTYSSKLPTTSMRAMLIGPYHLETRVRGHFNHHHHPHLQKRACMLVFKGGCSVPLPQLPSYLNNESGPPSSLENKQHTCFWGWLLCATIMCLFLRVFTLCHHHYHSPTLKMSIHTRFQRSFLFSVHI